MNTQEQFSLSHRVSASAHTPTDGKDATGTIMSVVSSIGAVAVFVAYLLLPIVAS